MLLTLLLTSTLVRTQVGTLPILISAPHGGTQVVPNCSERTGVGVGDFVTVRDTYTEELALEIAAEIERISGKKPHYVIASFSRKFVDVNRSFENGAESDAGRAVWNEYHDALKAAITGMGKGLVIDVHGQGRTANTVYRGTRNGATIKLPTGRSRDNRTSSPASLFPMLCKAGWTVFPTGDEAKEDPSFTGGYISGTYGGKAYPTSAIQMEFGGDYRRNAAARAETARVLAPILLQIVGEKTR